MKIMLSLITRIGLFSAAKPRVLSCFNGCMYGYRHCSIASKFINDSEEKKTEKWVPFSNASSSLISHNIGKYHEKSQLDSTDIMVVDSDTWRVSCGLASVCKGMNNEEKKSEKWVSFSNASSSLISHNIGKYHEKSQLISTDIMVVDSDTWRVSCGLASVCKGMNNELELKGFNVGSDDDGVVGNDNQGIVEGCPNFDEIEDMRVYGNLFYKVDRNSMEFEECRIDFRRKKNPKNDTGNNKKDIKAKENPTFDSSKKKRGVNNEVLVNEERLKTTIKENYTITLKDNNNNNSSLEKKKKRAPTYNQLTGPYHEPFCLDIYVSKGSVRASVIHRATSKVVAVAHSISKDIKYDLGSTKSRTAAVTVGRILAQRALEDDIHNVLFVPRKGDKLEGKVQIVLQSILDHGVDVKVKLKQRNYGRPFAKVNRFKR